MRLGGNAILLKDVHLKKAGTPISVWLVGSVISLRDVHPEKVPFHVEGIRVRMSRVASPNQHPTSRGTR